VHHVSHWGFEETWSGFLCLEKRNINLKVFVYERLGAGRPVPGPQLQVSICETRKVRVLSMKQGGSSEDVVFQVDGIVSQA
jgi:uncharacterized circularly permuted ATP-grasp superfamily protein